MRKLSSSIFAILLASGTMAGSAAASDGTAPGRTFQLAVGAGRFEGQSPIGQTDVLMHINASSTDGEGVIGRFSVHRWLPTELQMHGEVTCLKVVGNRATVGGRVDDIRAGVWPGQGILITVEDNGQGGIDRMHGDPLANPPAECPTPPEKVRLPVQDGNFVVVDR